MKIRTSLLMLAFCLLAVSAFAANDALMGTWKLNESKSKLAAGGPKNNTVTYEAAGDSIKVTIDGTAADGSATHSEWTGKFDGKDYPSTGNPGEDARGLLHHDFLRHRNPRSRRLEGHAKGPQHDGPDP